MHTITYHQNPFEAIMHSTSILPILWNDLSNSLSSDTVLFLAFVLCFAVASWDFVHRVRAFGFTKQQQANTSRHARDTVIGTFAGYVCEIDAFAERVAIQRGL
jgi:hypothetical protein